MAKLFAVVAFFAFVAVASATVAVTTYSDSGCTDAVGHFQSNINCILITKRAVAGSCIDVNGLWTIYDECTETTDTPVTPIPSGWQSIKYAASPICDFNETYSIIAAANTDVVVEMQIFTGSPFNLNVTFACNNGLLDLFSCSVYGCSSFEMVPVDECRNLTTTVFDSIQTGIQTSCVAAPEAPMAAPSAPMASTPSAGTPSSAPTASNTPVKAPSKSSEAVSVVVASVLAVVATTATLLC